MVSFTARAVAAIQWEVERLDVALPVVVQSELVANETTPTMSADARAAVALASPLVSQFHAGERLEAVLVHTTRASGLTVGAAMAHVIDGPDGLDTTIESYDDLGRLTITTTVAPGRPLRLVKFLAHGWSNQRTGPAIHDQGAAGVAGARHPGWGKLVKERPHRPAPTAPLSAPRL